MKGHVFRALGGLLLSEARVLAVRHEGRFVTLDLESAALDRARPGDKIQVLLPDHQVRTYTPIPGRPHRLLVFLHGDTPGPRWARAVRPGEVLRFKGPDRSLDLPAGKRVIVGDETSVAVARSYPDALALIESASPIEGLRTFARGDHAALAAAVPEGAVVGLTGGATLIQGVRRHLRERGMAPHVKTYWAPGRAGLD